MKDPGKLLAPMGVFDMRTFGRDLRSLRLRRGFNLGVGFTDLLASAYGVAISDRTLYAIERGEQMPRLDFYIAVSCALNAERDYFSPAIRDDCLDKLKARVDRP